MHTTQRNITLEYVKTIGLTTNNTGRGFVNPYDTAISRDGRIFVLNHSDSARRAMMRIGICTLDEEYLGDGSVIGINGAAGRRPA